MKSTALAQRAILAAGLLSLVPLVGPLDAQVKDLHFGIFRHVDLLASPQEGEETGFQTAPSISSPRLESPIAGRGWSSWSSRTSTASW